MFYPTDWPSVKVMLRSYDLSFETDYITEYTGYLEGQLPSPTFCLFPQFQHFVSLYSSLHLALPNQREQYIHLILSSLFSNCAFDPISSCFFMTCCVNFLLILVSISTIIFFSANKHSQMDSLLKTIATTTEIAP